MATETIVIQKKEYSALKREIETLRKTSIYKRLLEFEKNITTGKKFGRADLGF